MRTRLPVGSIVALSILTGCMLSASAEQIVRTAAIRDTDCANIEVTRGSAGVYEARGCGKLERYACDRPSGTGCSKPAAITEAGCHKLNANPEEP
jgi:hypothetical protein